MTGRRRSLPGLPAMAAAIIGNGFVAYIVLALTFCLFGITHILGYSAFHLDRYTLMHAAPKWELVRCMVPGAAIGYALLWFWLIVLGRMQGVQWPASVVYGSAIALADIPLSGLLIGIEQGNPLMGLLRGVATLLLVPAIWLAMAFAGTILGVFNAYLAEKWIQFNRSN